MSSKLFITDKSGATLLAYHGSLQTIAKEYATTRNIPYDESIALLEDEYQEGACIWEVEVPDNWRGKGVGTRLMLLTQEKLERLGCEIIICYALPEAERFWIGLGYSHLTKSPNGSWMYRDV